MARKLRIEQEGAICHVVSRGDRRKSILQDDQERETFLETFGQCCARTGWQLHAFCRRWREVWARSMTGRRGGRARWSGRSGSSGEELSRAGWDEAPLGSRPKGHRVNVRVALRLRGETTVTYPWIAEWLRMGSRSHASNLVYAKQKQQK